MRTCRSRGTRPSQVSAASFQAVPRHRLDLRPIIHRPLGRGLARALARTDGVSINYKANKRTHAACSHARGMELNESERQRVQAPHGRLRLRVCRPRSRSTSAAPTSARRWRIALARSEPPNGARWRSA